MPPVEKWLTLDELTEPAERRREWFRYYSEKRITHQWFQVHLLEGLAGVERVLEIGAHLGLVTALLDNAGFEVTTLDRWPKPGKSHRGREGARGSRVATDGHCTHEQTHLADGFVIDEIIECPMHQGRFNIPSGKALSAPAISSAESSPSFVTSMARMAGETGIWRPNPN